MDYPRNALLEWINKYNIGDKIRTVEFAKVQNISTKRKLKKSFTSRYGTICYKCKNYVIVQFEHYKECFKLNEEIDLIVCK